MVKRLEHMTPAEKAMTVTEIMLRLEKSSGYGQDTSTYKAVLIGLMKRLTHRQLIALHAMITTEK